MSAGQIIFKTVVTTVDMLLAMSVIKSDDSTDSLKKTFTVITLLNIAGVWV